MTVALDTPIRVGAVTVAALVDRTVRSGHRGAVAIHASKRPIAILIRRDGVTSAFDVGGRAISLDEFERRFPGQRAAFEEVAGSSTRVV